MRSNIQFDRLTRMHYHAIKDVPLLIIPIEKLILCVYSVITDLRNVDRIFEKPLKHSATPRINNLLSYFFNFSRARYHPISIDSSFSIF